MKLALTLPGWFQQGTTVPDRISNPAANFPASTTTLADIISKFSEVALYAGGFLMFFWAVWGVFDYIRAEGNKESLAKARKRIQWAIAGFIILIMSFFISNLVKTVINPGVPPLTEVKLR